MMSKSFVPCLVLAVSLVGASAAGALEPLASLVKDINTAGPVDPDFISSSPRQLTAAGDKVFFAATEPGSGTELWVSDGTAVGTELLEDLAPGPGSSAVHAVGALGNLFVWAAVDGSSELSLRRSDGTRTGTFEISVPAERFTGLAAIAGHLIYFTACEASDCRLWTSDGTPGGARLVQASPHFIQTSLLLPLGNRVFFSTGGTFWVSDGSEAGTHAVAPDPGAEKLTATGNRVYFLAHQQLWTSDGTALGTIQLTRFTHIAPFLRTGFLLPSGNSVYFTAGDDRGEDLWTSDGTTAGTRRLTDFSWAYPFGNGLSRNQIAVAGGKPVFVAQDAKGVDHAWTSAAGKAVVLTSFPLSPFNPVVGQGNGRAYFPAGDGVHGIEPWVTDGTLPGTHLLKDLCRGACDSNTADFIAGRQATYFQNGDALWQTDGTEAGTHSISSPPFIFAGSPQDPVEAGNKLFVAGASPAYGFELWVRDPAAPLHLVTDIARTEPSSRPQELLSAGGTLWLTACDGTERSLWQVVAGGGDATAIPATARDCVNTSGDATPWGLTANGGLVFYLRDDSNSLHQLWRSDGSAAGTIQLTALPSPVQARNGSDLTYGGLTAFQGKVLFETFNFSAGSGGTEEIWESDGTPEGTRKSPYLPGNSSSVRAVRAVGSELYFFTVDDQGPWLWRSDGTAAGTRKVAPLSPDADHGTEPLYVRLGDAVFLIASSPGSRRQLWRTNGTAAGTQALLDVDGGAGDGYRAELTVFQGNLYIFTDDSSGNETLWRSDGTPAGTTPLKAFPFPLNGGGLTLHHSFTAAAGKLFFRQSEDEHGAELWATDGTPQGTAVVKDIVPGPGSSRLDGLTGAGDRLFFTAGESDHGIELWQSDGTAAGTRMVQDIAPEGLSSSPAQLTVSGDRLYFTADDGFTGRELWSLPLTGPGGCQASSAHLCLGGSGGGRYQVEASWNDGQGHAGQGTAVALSADTGYFWFFSPANVEAVVKVLDGTGVNGHVWVFYGALSNVEYTLTVTDTQTGLTRRYFNPQGQLASVGDIYGFGPRGANGANPHPSITTAAPSPLALTAERQGKAATVPCHADAQTLCLSGDRFAVTVAWKDFQGHTGNGTAVPLSGDTGTFWFFNASNIELVVKALDGRPVNNHFWLFYGALSNVEYTLTVTDTQTGKIKTYSNPSGRFASVGDTLAF
jgi:ELWxxDGT repeat protein